MATPTLFHVIANEPLSIGSWTLILEGLKKEKRLSKDSRQSAVFTHSEPINKE